MNPNQGRTTFFVLPELDSRLAENVVRPCFPD